jgi:hypothetical protein
LEPALHKVLLEEPAVGGLRAHLPFRAPAFMPGVVNPSGDFSR